MLNCFDEFDSISHSAESTNRFTRMPSPSADEIAEMNELACVRSFAWRMNGEDTFCVDVSCHPPFWYNEPGVMFLIHVHKPGAFPPRARVVSSGTSLLNGFSSMSNAASCSEYERGSGRQTSGDENHIEKYDKLLS